MPHRGRTMGAPQPSPKASAFAKASAVAEAMVDKTEDETAGRLPMPRAPSSIGKCTRMFLGRLFALYSVLRIPFPVCRSQYPEEGRHG